MALFTVLQQSLVREADVNHCTCSRHRRHRTRLRSGIRVVVVAGMIYAGYVAYERNLFHLEDLSAAIAWFADRLRSEIETQKRLEELSSQIKMMEKHSTQLQRSLDKLTEFVAAHPPAGPRTRRPAAFLGHSPAASEGPRHETCRGIS